MPTAFNVLLQTCRNLETLIESTSTSVGSSNTLVDSAINAAIGGRSDDEFIGGSLFLKTNTLAGITNESVGSVAGAVTFSGSLSVHPAPSTLIVLNTPGGGGIVAYGLPDIGTISSAGDTILAEAVTGTSGTLAHRNLTTGYINFSDSGGIVADDAGGGILIDHTTLTPVGSIDYVTGAWTYTGGATLTTVYYKYSYVVGTTDLNGFIGMSFSEPRTGAITATYTPANSLFVSYIPIVSDFTAVSGTVTFTPASTTVIGTPANYALMSNRYPIILLLQKLNEVLNEINDYITTTTILKSSIINNEYAYSDNNRVLHVWQGYTISPTDNKRWQPVTRYTRVNGVIRFQDTIAGDTVIIESVGSPAAVTATGSITDTYSLEWLALATAVKCCRWRLMQPGADERLITIQLNDLITRERQALRNRRWMPPLAVLATPTAWPEN